MLDIFTVSFFGHRYIEDLIILEILEQKVEKIISELINTKEYVEFLVGRDGEFDQIVSSAIIRSKRDVFDGNSYHVCVLPYTRAEYTKNTEAFDKYYDEVEICEESSKAHPKGAIQIRNRSMVDRADLCIFYVKRNKGGAWQTFNYAKKQGKVCINLADNVF